MFRNLIAFVAAAALAGCAASGSTSPFGESPTPGDQSRLAAFAAQVELPDFNQANQDLQASALVNRGNDTITIRNFSDQTLRDVRVFVNREYIREIDSIPAHGSVTIHQDQFYDRQGQNLGNQNVTVNTVHMQTQDQLFQLQGPQYR